MENTDIDPGQLYNGGNPATESYSDLPSIREFIFQNATGSICTLVLPIFDAVC